MFVCACVRACVCACVCTRVLLSWNIRRPLCECRTRLFRKRSQNINVYYSVYRQFTNEIYCISVVFGKRFFLINPSRIHLHCNVVCCLGFLQRTQKFNFSFCIILKTYIASFAAVAKSVKKTHTSIVILFGF